MHSIDISNYVNISTTISPSGLPEFNPNIIGFFTTDSFINGNLGDIYRNYINASSVASDFGTNSSTYALASLLFSQSPNIRAGGGSLNIIPMLNAVSATQGSFTTADIAANLTNIILVDDGSITVTVDGTVFNLTNLDFTKCQTWQQVADVFNTALAGYANVNILSILGVPSGLIFLSKTVGTSSTITLATLAGGTNISGATYLDVGAGTAAAGAASSGETLLEAKTRVIGEVTYMGFFTNLLMEDAEILAVAANTQAEQQIYMQEVASISAVQTGGIARQIAALNYTQTRILGHLIDINTAQQFKVAYTGRMFTVDFSGSNTTLTANLKQLTGVAPDTIVGKQSIITQFIAAGVDTYPLTAGSGYVNAQGNANDYFDNQYNEKWFDNQLQITLFNILAGTGTKIPQTEIGMLTLRNGIIDVCDQSVRNGMTGIGLKWNGDFFGNQELFIKSIYTNGYYIYQLPISQQSQADRENRVAPLFQVAVKLGGAVHFVQVNATLQQ